MNYNISDKVIPDIINPSEFDKQQVFGDNTSSGHVIIRTSKNEQLLYLDYAGIGGAPLYIGLTKSRGDQINKLPIGADDMIGGLQVYARTTPGNSLGYCQEETPLAGGLHFKVSSDYCGTGSVPTEFLLALTNTDGMSIKLKVDAEGNLQTAGNITSGNLTITDQEVIGMHLPTKFVKAILAGVEYAIALHPILEK
jgi:hypothetical protein